MDKWHIILIVSVFIAFFGGVLVGWYTYSEAMWRVEESMFDEDD